jgi:ATP-dependent Clp protease, protease subunit
LSYLIPTVIDKTQHGERAYDIYSRLLEERIVYLGTQVDDTSANNIIAQMLFLDYKDPKKDIIFYINTGGGSVTAGLGIFDTMNLITADVSTVCIGQACSMGCFLLAAGAKGKRYATPSATIMAHQVLGGARGQATDILIQNAETQRLKKYLTKVLAENCGMDYEKMYELCERDYFMDAEHAQSLGFIDSIIGKKSQNDMSQFKGAVNH